MSKSKPNQEVELLSQQLAEAEAKWKRALADYQNLEKRVADQKAAYAKLATISLISKILSAIDDLERAANHLKDNGVAMITNQLTNALKEEGLVEITAQGEKFDPTTMECVEVVAGEKDVVIKVVQKGYLIFDTVLRPAKVEVGSGETQKTN